MEKILFYEVGYEESEIFGFGSTYHPHWSGKSEEAAFAEFEKLENNYMSRYYRCGQGLCSQHYQIAP